LASRRSQTRTFMCGERRAALPQPPEGGLQLNAGVRRNPHHARTLSAA
jgi:hypothetical protein